MVMPVEELAARLGARRDALRQMGTLEDVSTCAWWRDEPENTKVRWILGSAPYGPNRCAVELLSSMLSALAHLDVEAFHRQVKYLCSPEAASPSARDTMLLRHGECSWELGFAYAIYSPEDIGPVCERIAGAQPPRDPFLNDYAWLHAVPFQVAQDETRPRPIAVHLRIRLSQAGTAELTGMLRALVDAMLVARQNEGSVNDHAARRSRFQVVKVDIDERWSVPVNIESLECLAQLAQLGVRVRNLPAIHLADAASQDPRPVVAVLQTLMPPGLASTTSTSLSQARHVIVDEMSSSRFIPGIFSALQASYEVETVRLDVQYDPTYDMEGVENAPDPDAASTLWKWAAYALFSHQACPSLKKVVVNLTHLGHDILDRVEDVLEADDPFSALFNTPLDEDELSESDDPTLALLDGAFVEEKWIQASRFHVHDPRMDGYDSDSSLYVTQTPVRVRVVDSLDREESRWWHVVLPGCGHAWVLAADATTINPDDVELAAAAERSLRAKTSLHIKFEEVYSFHRGEIMRLLELLPHDLAGIEIETGQEDEDGFDMTNMMVESLRLFRDLERIEFNCFAEVRRLSVFVEAAEYGYARLRSMTLFNTFYAHETDDVFDYLAVLCDNNHPLTKRLEELGIAVAAHDDASFERFESAWRRMLRCNRKLHTISLLLTSANDDRYMDE